MALQVEGRGESCGGPGPNERGDHPLNLFVRPAFHFIFTGESIAVVPTNEVASLIPVLGGVNFSHLHA